MCMHQTGYKGDNRNHSGSLNRTGLEAGSKADEALGRTFRNAL